MAKKILIGVVVLVVIVAVATGVTSVMSKKETADAAHKREEAAASLAPEKEAYEEEHLEAINGSWASGIILDALTKLANEGAIAPLPEDAYLFTNVFEWERTGGTVQARTVAFTSEEAQRRLTGDFELPDGKVVIATEKGFVYSTDKSMYYLTGGEQDAELADVPAFYPSSGIDAALLDGIPQNRFANKLYECDYIIAYDGVMTHEEEHYYNYGASGYFTTTFVMVVDARSHEVLHIETIGTTSPDARVTEGEGSRAGRVMEEEAFAYMRQLLA